MTLRIYGPAASRTFRTLWMAEELGLDYEHVPTPFSPEGTGSAAFLAMNPNGKVPVIDDDGFILSESMAINLYLARRHEKKGLAPKEFHTTARAVQWTFWAVLELEQPFIAWARHAGTLPGFGHVSGREPRDEALAAAAAKELEPPLGVLDGELGKRPYLVGDSFTVADLNVASICYRALWLKPPGRPNFSAWLERCYERPAAKKARRMRES
jgi:glutathione S-transferase